MNITQKILNIAKARGRGWVFATKDLLYLGNRSTIDKILSRLVAKGVIRRIGRGIYDFPIKHKLLGMPLPSKNDLLQAISSKTGESICPSGATSANLLGLSEQVPTRPYFITNGKSRVIKLSNQTIILKHSRLPVLTDSPMANRMLQALQYIGKNNIDDEIVAKCSKILDKKLQKTLISTMPRIPSWMSDTLHKVTDYKPS